MRYTLLLIAWIYGLTVQAQEVADSSYYPDHTREIGLNLTPLLVQLAPLNRLALSERYFGHTYKRWGRELAFRFTFGMSLTTVQDEFFGTELNTVRFYMGFGWERIKRRWNNWQFNNGAEIALFTGSLSEGSSDIDETLGFGYLPFYEIQYHVNDFIYVATATRLLFGWNFDEELPVIRVIAPLDVQVFVKF